MPGPLALRAAIAAFSFAAANLSVPAASAAPDTFGAEVFLAALDDSGSLLVGEFVGFQEGVGVVGQDVVLADNAFVAGVQILSLSTITELDANTLALTIELTTDDGLAFVDPGTVVRSGDFPDGLPPTDIFFSLGTGLTNGDTIDFGRPIADVAATFGLFDDAGQTLTSFPIDAALTPDGTGFSAAANVDGGGADLSTIGIAGGVFDFTVTLVPEPATAGLIGFAAVGLLRRRGG